jgi:hypothetical protein
MAYWYPTEVRWHQLSSPYHTVIRFVSIRAKFGICAVVGLNGTLVDANILTCDT